MKQLTTFLAIAAFSFAGLLHADEPKPYPLKTCVVSGEEIGGMGKPVVFVYEGQEIKLCCKSCKPKFEKDPERYMKMLQTPVESEPSETEKPATESANHQH